MAMNSKLCPQVDNKKTHQAPFHSIGSYPSSSPSAAFPSHNNHPHSVEEQAQIPIDVRVADLSSLADCYLS